MTSILWFKRDLRVTDHPALLRAATAGPVLPTYIVEPDCWQEPDMSGRQIYAVRSGDNFRQEAAKVIDRHASRKDPRGHFVNDRELHRKSVDQRQRAFDF